MNFPKPLYKVEYKEKGRAHIYPVTLSDGTAIGPLPSVTRIQSIINKPALVPWAKREALKRAKEEIEKYIQGGQTLNQIALDALMILASKEPDKQKDKAADIGTRTHEAIDKWISGEMPTLDDDVKPGFNNFQHWLETEKIRILRGDTAIASVVNKYGGRADGYGEKDGKVILIDFKTGRALYDDTVVQIGGYDIATKETYGLQVDRAIVLRIGKEVPGDIEPKEVNLEKGRNAFMAALSLFNAMQEKEKLWL